jgi:hypothetical protein
MRAVGFWWAPWSRYESFPHPYHLIDPDWDPAQRAAVLAHLRAGAEWRQFLSLKPCSLCGERTGNTYVSDGAWFWPLILAHEGRAARAAPPRRIRGRRAGRHAHPGRPRGARRRFHVVVAMDAGARRWRHDRPRLVAREGRSGGPVRRHGPPSLRAAGLAQRRPRRRAVPRTRRISPDRPAQRGHRPALGRPPRAPRPLRRSPRSASPTSSPASCCGSPTTMPSSPAL